MKNKKPDDAPEVTPEEIPKDSSKPAIEFSEKELEGILYLARSSWGGCAPAEPGGVLLPIINSRAVANIVATVELKAEALLKLQGD